MSKIKGNLIGQTKILENWKQQITSYKKLKFKEAQEFYKKAISITDSEEKKKHMEELILGTLYVVCNYIERNNIKVFTSSKYDMNDIINAFNEVWIKRIINGELLNVSGFSIIIKTSSFFTEVLDKLGVKQISIFELTKMELNEFIDSFIKYIELKKNEKIDTYDDFIKYASDLPLRWYHICYPDTILNIFTYEIFENMYKYLNFDEKEKLNIGETTVRNYLRLMIDNSISDPILRDMSTDDSLEESILKKIDYDNFIKNVEPYLCDNQTKDIIYQRFGFIDGETHSREEIGKVLNTTGEKVRQIEEKTIRTLERSLRIQGYQNLL